MLQALGEAESLKAVGAGLVQPSGVAAAHVKLAQAHMQMMGQLGASSNTMLLSGGGGGPTSLEDMAARVTAVMSGAGIVPQVQEDPSVRVQDVVMGGATALGNSARAEATAAAQAAAAEARSLAETVAPQRKSSQAVQASTARRAEQSHTPVDKSVPQSIEDAMMDLDRFLGGGSGGSSSSR